MNPMGTKTVVSTNVIKKTKRLKLSPGDLFPQKVPDGITLLIDPMISTEYDIPVTKFRNDHYFKKIDTDIYVDTKQPFKDGETVNLLLPDYKLSFTLKEYSTNTFILV